MENSQTPSVFFVPSHHNFGDKGVPFVGSMLTWPFYFSTVPEQKCISERTISVYRNAIMGFNAIPNFVMKVSIKADTENNKFYFAKRTWGVIYLSDKQVLSFSHSQNDGQHAFRSLFDWPESKAEQSEGRGIWEHIPDETIETWDATTWTLFFKTRIIEHIKMLETKATRKRRDADELEAAVNMLLNALK